MFNSRAFRILVVFILIVSVTGCGALQKKFTRKKKKEEIMEQAEETLKGVFLCIRWKLSLRLGIG